MAYMRGDYYLWKGESGLHLWAADGYDAWDISGWHMSDDGGTDDDGEANQVNPSHLRDGENKASGVSIHQEIMDEYVMMRLAEMLEEGQLEATLERAMSKWGRASLERNAPRLRAAFQRAQAHPPAV